MSGLCLQVMKKMNIIVFGVAKRGLLHYSQGVSE